MVNETVDYAELRDWEDARKRDEVNRLVSKNPEFSTTKHISGLTIWKKIETASTRPAGIFSRLRGSPKEITEKETSKQQVAEFEREYDRNNTKWINRIIVTDRDSYAFLKEVAEQIPWMDEIQKKWSFNLDEDPEPGSHPQVQQQKRQKKLEETDARPRYEKLKEVGK